MMYRGLDVAGAVRTRCVSHWPVTQRMRGTGAGLYCTYMMYCTIDCIRTLLLYKVCSNRELLPPLLVISILKLQNVISSQVRLAIRGYEDKKIRERRGPTCTFAASEAGHIYSFMAMRGFPTYGQWTWIRNGTHISGQGPTSQLLPYLSITYQLSKLDSYCTSTSYWALLKLTYIQDSQRQRVHTSYRLHISNARISHIANQALSFLCLNSHTSIHHGTQDQQPNRAVVPNI